MTKPTFTTNQQIWHAIRTLSVKHKLLFHYDCGIHESFDSLKRKYNRLVKLTASK